LFKRAAFTASLPLVTGLQLLIGTFLLIPIAALAEGTPNAHFHPSSVVALAYLVVVMSIGASLLWFWLLERGEASRLSAYYYVTPVLGLVLSWLLAREPLHPTDLAGASVVALGIALVQRPGKVH
jgi:drug/metabolite transporter (DMT)-like permease